MVDLGLDDGDWMPPEDEPPLSEEELAGVQADNAAVRVAFATPRVSLLEPVTRRELRVEASNVGRALRAAGEWCEKHEPHLSVVSGIAFEQGDPEGPHGVVLRLELYCG